VAAKAASIMTDVVFLFLVLALLAATLGLVRLCERV
jgi:hypothetical protein